MSWWEGGDRWDVNDGERCNVGTGDPGPDFAAFVKRQDMVAPRLCCGTEGSPRARVPGSCGGYPSSRRGVCGGCQGHPSRVVCRTATVPAEVEWWRSVYFVLRSVGCRLVLRVFEHSSFGANCRLWPHALWRRVRDLVDYGLKNYDGSH